MATGIFCKACVLVAPDQHIHCPSCTNFRAVSWCSLTDHQNNVVKYVCGFQCVDCYQVIVADPNLNPNPDRIYQLHEVMGVMGFDRTVHGREGLLPTYVVCPMMPIWEPIPGHVCESMHLISINNGNQLVARCATCGTQHPTIPSFYPQLAEFHGSTTPTSQILFALVQISNIIRIPCQMIPQPQIQEPQVQSNSTSGTNLAMSSPTKPTPSQTKKPEQLLEEQLKKDLCLSSLPSSSSSSQSSSLPSS